MVSRITRVLAEFDGSSERLFDQRHAWVYIVEVPDGSMGVCGQPAPLTKMMKMVIQPDEPLAARPQRPGVSAADVFVDPVCGMSVENASVVTLEHDGSTYAFCCRACRDSFAEQHGIVP